MVHVFKPWIVSRSSREWQTRCGCGWRGDWRRTLGEAVDDAEGHVSG